MFFFIDFFCFTYVFCVSPSLSPSVPDGWRCLQSTPGNEGENGAHTKDPLSDEAAMSSELCISYIICVACLIKMEYFQPKSFRILGQQGSSLKDAAANRAHQDQDTVTDDPANGAH